MPAWTVYLAVPKSAKYKSFIQVRDRPLVMPGIGAVERVPPELNQLSAPFLAAKVAPQGQAAVETRDEEIMWSSSLAPAFIVRDPKPGT